MQLTDIEGMPEDKIHELTTAELYKLAAEAFHDGVRMSAVVAQELGDMKSSVHLRLMSTQK